MKLFDQQGNPVDVPDEEAAAHLASGQFGLPAGSKVPVKLQDGRIGTVPVEGITGALQKGASVIPQEQYDAHQEQKKYGDALHGAEAVGLGALRGVTLGGSDAAAGAIGGDFADSVKHIEHANPGLTTAGEVGGAIGTALVPGLGEAEGANLAAHGAELAAGAEEAASAANAASHFGEVAGTALRAPVKLLSQPLRQLNEVGNLVERGVSKIVGSEAKTLAGKIGQKAAALGARGVVENAIMSGGDEIGEEALGDPELNGQKILAAVGHGALLGLGVGAAGGAVGAVGSEVLGRLSTKLSGQAEEQAFRALNPLKAATLKAEDLPGGSRGVGRQLIDDGVIQPGDSIEEIAPKVAAAKDKAGENIGSILESADEQGYEGPALHNVVADIKSNVLPRLEALPLAE